MRFNLTGKQRAILADYAKTIAVAGYVLGLYQTQIHGIIIGTLFLVAALVFAPKEVDK